MNKKKIAVAIAAVTTFIKTEEEARASIATTRPAQRVNSMWAVAGRSSMMQLADLMQMKAFHTKLR